MNDILSQGIVAVLHPLLLTRKEGQSVVLKRRALLRVRNERKRTLPVVLLRTSSAHKKYRILKNMGGMGGVRRAVRLT